MSAMLISRNDANAMTTQKIEKSAEGTFLSGSAIYLSANIINAAIPFLLLPILTRYLSPEDFGSVAMYQTVLTFLGALVGLNVIGAAARKYYDDLQYGEQIAEFIGTCVQIIGISTAFTLLVLLVFSEFFSDLLKLNLNFLILALLTATLSSLISLRLGQWQIRKKPLHFGSLQIAQSAFNFLLSLTLVAILPYGADGRIMAITAATAVAACIAIFTLQRDGLLSLFSYRPQFIQEALKFGVPLLPHTLGVLILSFADRVIIANHLGLGEAGVYMVAVQVSLALPIVFDAINNAFVPWLFERLKQDNPHEKTRIVKLTYLWFCIILAGVSVGFLIGPTLLIRLVGVEYKDAGDVFFWLILGQGFGGMYLMVTNYIFYSKRTMLLSAVTIFSGILHVGLVLYLVPIWGIVGAGKAFAISMGIRFLLTWHASSQSHSMPWFCFGFASKK